MISVIRLKPYQAGDALDLSTISKINLIEDVIEEYYYDYKDTELTLDDKRNGLYRGLVDSLGDRYSRYFTAEELADEIEEDQGVYYGVGAYISLGDNGYPFFSGIMETFFCVFGGEVLIMLGNGGILIGKRTERRRAFGETI